jgi:hypothetical protein
VAQRQNASPILRRFGSTCVRKAFARLWRPSDPQASAQAHPVLQRTEALRVPGEKWRLAHRKEAIEMTAVFRPTAHDDRISSKSILPTSASSRPLRSNASGRERDRPIGTGPHTRCSIRSGPSEMRQRSACSDEDDRLDEVSRALLCADAALRLAAARARPDTLEWGAATVRSALIARAAEGTNR